MNKYLEKKFFNLKVDSIRIYNELDLQKVLNEMTNFKVKDFLPTKYVNTEIERDVWIRHVGLWASNIKTFEKFMDSEYDYLIIFEDDVVLCKNFYDEFMDRFKSLPKDWDLFVINSHPKSDIQYHENKRIKGSKICEGYTLFGTGAVCYNKNSVKKILNSITDGVSVPIDWLCYHPEFGLELKYYDIDPKCGRITYLATWLKSTIDKEREIMYNGIMPTYEYTCMTCDESQEIVRKFEDEEIIPPCPSCGYRMVRSYTAPGIQFKGSGFYKTDHGK